MPKFAVYYVPDQRDAFYQLGTQLLQYDVRRQAPAQRGTELRERLGASEPFEDSWIAIARPYGFHLTIGDAIDCSWGAITAAERELENLLRCFDPARPFQLHRRSDQAITVWGSADARVLVLPFLPNDALLLLHALVTARINPLGTGSGFLQRLIAGQVDEVASDPVLDPVRTQQTRLFYSPTVLGNWYPHVTLLNPYTGRNLDVMKQVLADAFAPYAELSVSSICLMAQADDDNHWRIYREFPHA